jgi:predicted Holliday junction resolvase-like endonuclease
MVFIGKSFDHLVLDVLTEGQARKIVFLEVKSGSSRLNPNKKIIATIVAQKKAIEWKKCRS